MRQLFVIMAIFSIFAVFAIPASATQMAMVGAQCNYGLCFENNLANWTFAVENTENVSINVSRIRVVDIVGVPVVDSNFNASIVPSGQTAVFSIISRLPPPTRGTTLYFKSCFTVNDKEFCEQNPNQATVFALRDVKCLFSDNCADTEACAITAIGTDCMKLDCANNTFAQNHTCATRGPIITLGDVNLFLIIIIVLVVAMIILMVLLLRRTKAARRHDHRGHYSA